MNIAAFDVASRCGVAWLVDDEKALYHTCWNLARPLLAKRLRPLLSAEQARDIRLVNLHSKLHWLIAEYGPFDAWVHEAPIIVGGGQGGRTLVRGQAIQRELHGVLKLVALWHEIPLTPYAVATIKKHAGSGRYKKEQMIRSAVQRFGAVSDDNEADALWLLDCALHKKTGRRLTLNNR